MRRKWMTFMMMLVVLTSWSGAAAAEADKKPALGVCMVLTDNVKAENNVKPGEWLHDAMMRKIPQDRYQRGDNFPATDFITFLSKKDILPDESGLFKELKLPAFLDYAKSKQVDFLFVVIGDARVWRHIGTRIEQHKDSDNNVWTSSHDEEKIDYADIKLRTVLVDVAKNEYVFNIIIAKRSDSPDLFANGVRSVINDGMKKALSDFNAKVQIP